MKKGIFVTIYAFLLLAFPSVGVCDFPGIPSTSSSGSTVTDADADGAADLANYLKAVATSGKISIAGPAAGSTRAKTVRDADDTILELGGSYTPTGTWVWTSATVTWPTFNQNTTGTAANLSSVLSPTSGGTGVANNVSSTITIAGAFGLTITITADRDLTIPISGTAVVTTEAITAKHLIRKADSGEGYVDAGAAIEATDGLTFHFDGGGSEIADNKIACTTAKFAMDITAWTIIPDQSGSIKIDIWKNTYANGLPTNANTITNGHEPEISSAAKAQDTDLADWTTLAVAAGDIVCASVDSATTITWANLVLTGMRK